jgi:hypothetical protein
MKKKQLMPHQHYEHPTLTEARKLAALERRPPCWELDGPRRPSRPPRAIDGQLSIFDQGEV